MDIFYNEMVIVAVWYCCAVHSVWLVHWQEKSDR